MSSDKYTIGSLLRIFTADRSKHYTAVVLKDGKLLEVKNPETTERTMFESVEKYLELRLVDGATLEVSDKETVVKERKEKVKVEGVKSKKNKIRCPKASGPWSNWIRWCYSIMKEGARDLLSNEDVIVAYNTYAKILFKYKDELSTDQTFTRKYYRYNLTNITETSKEIVNIGSTWGLGAQFWFTNGKGYNASVPEEKRYTLDDFKRIRAEIKAAYVELHALVAEPISTYIKNYTTRKKCQDDLKYQLRVKHIYERKLQTIQDRYHREFDWVNRTLNEYKEKIAKTQKLLETVDTK